jgi:hypothetical protein
MHTLRSIAAAAPLDPDQQRTQNWTKQQAVQHQHLLEHQYQQQAAYCLLRVLQSATADCYRLPMVPSPVAAAAAVVAAAQPRPQLHQPLQAQQQHLLAAPVQLSGTNP